MSDRLQCRAVFLDAGGVIALPDRRLVAAALARAGVEIDPVIVPRAHYRAVRLIDASPGRDGYPQALCRALGVAAERMPAAVGAIGGLADRERSGVIMWREPVPDAQRVMSALADAGVGVVIVTNSDGHAEENLRGAGICRTSADGAGVRVSHVIDSTRVGVAKPDPEIFRIALRAAGLGPESVVHVGDTLSTDVAGAQAAGITPIHFDPYRGCRSSDHRHLRSLAGVWRHVAPAP